MGRKLEASQQAGWVSVEMKYLKDADWHLLLKEKWAWITRHKGGGLRTAVWEQAEMETRVSRWTVPVQVDIEFLWKEFERETHRVLSGIKQSLYGTLI